MEDYGAMIRSTFELGSVRDGESLFENMIKNAFPTNTFRRLELIRFLRDTQYMEGRSWNHVFEITRTELNGSPVWAVQCRRVTMGKSPDKNVYLDYMTLGFVGYIP
jgi:pentatricopeptide repeat protein